MRLGMQVDDRPEKVCVLGWGPHSLMVDLVKELDHGLSALPKGSEVVFVNMHNPHDSLGQVLQHITLENVQVRPGKLAPVQGPPYDLHINLTHGVFCNKPIHCTPAHCCTWCCSPNLQNQPSCRPCMLALAQLTDHTLAVSPPQVRHVLADPLQRSSLAGALDVSQFRCAVVLCDESWVDPDNNEANGLDSLDEPSVLRLDSLVMVAQVGGHASKRICTHPSG
jgi:hypothetical protein